MVKDAHVQPSFNEFLLISLTQKLSEHLCAAMCKHAQIISVTQRVSPEIGWRMTDRYFVYSKQKFRGSFFFFFLVMLVVVLTCKCYRENMLCGTRVWRTVGERLRLAGRWVLQVGLLSGSGVGSFQCTNARVFFWLYQQCFSSCCNSSTSLFLEWKQSLGVIMLICYQLCRNRI